MRCLNENYILHVRLCIYNGNSISMYRNHSSIVNGAVKVDVKCWVPIVKSFLLEIKYSDKRLVRTVSLSNIIIKTNIFSIIKLQALA